MKSVVIQVYSLDIIVGKALLVKWSCKHSLLISITSLFVFMSIKLVTLKLIN